ncbi:hypothetical protein RhiirC2_792394 [Rhizophagus irregularis]|uniref:Uncharacterized protein n=1 Tax=Rhizophagus irregularis TaxID=588596 RepID=A0A2N1MHD6_9GLOM|nr:hypothetical protein RhiirC2_792394 [Rhizophagus irregularis]
MVLEDSNRNFIGLEGWNLEELEVSNVPMHITAHEQKTIEETNKIVQTTADKSIEMLEETIQWYSDLQKSYVEEYIGSFHEIFEEHLLEIMKLKMIKEVENWEKREFGSLTITGPGGTKPERLNIKKEGTKVSTEQVLRNREDYDIIGQELEDSKATSEHLEKVLVEKVPIITQESETLKSELTQNRNKIVDLENKIRNLEEKLKVLNDNKENSASLTLEMEVDTTVKHAEKH